MSNFIQIQNGNCKIHVLPENLAKVEAKIAKVKPPKWGQTFTNQKDNKRFFPAYTPGMGTGEYISRYNSLNNKLSLSHAHDLMAYPESAAQYDPALPLCEIDENPDYDPATDTAPAPKAKAPRISKQAARIAELENALRELSDIFWPMLYNAEKYEKPLLNARALLNK